MKQVQVFGPGCQKCQLTAKLILDIAAERGVAVQLEKIEDFAGIAQAGVMATPAVKVDGRLVHSGGMPKREAVAEWLRA